MEAELIQKDIDELDFEPDSFDCIVSTLTICSYPDPVDTLKKFNNWCRNDGNVLLMEHGLSTNPLLSFTQKVIDPLHKKITGCHCNRNIHEMIVESNLQICHTESYWSGILTLIHAKPSS